MSLGLRRSFKLKFGCTTVHTGNVCGFIGGPSERTCLRSRRVNGGARAGGGGWGVREDLPDTLAGRLRPGGRVAHCGPGPRRYPPSPGCQVQAVRA